jgi:hypothetical protein
VPLAATAAAASTPSTVRVLPRNPNMNPHNLR